MISGAIQNLDFVRDYKSLRRTNLCASFCDGVSKLSGNSKILIVKKLSDYLLVLLHHANLVKCFQTSPQNNILDYLYVSMDSSWGHGVKILETN